MPDTAEAVAQYGSAVYRLAYAMTRSRSDADDVFQEVFLRLHRSAPDFANEEHRRAWLLRVTANCARSLLASPWRMRTLPLEDVYSYQDSVESAVDEALAHLPGKYRAVIHLFYYEGYQTEEIARILGRSPSTVRAQLTRARQKLRTLMNEPVGPSPDLIRKTLSHPDRHRLPLRRLAAAAAVAAVLLATPALAVRSETGYAVLYRIAPAVAQFFQPIQEACTDSGITMEVAAVRVEGDTAQAYIVLSGGPVDATTDLFDSWSFHLPFDQTGRCERVAWDEATGTVTFLCTVKTMDGSPIPTGGKMTFSVRQLLTGKKAMEGVTVDLKLTNYAQEAETALTWGADPPAAGVREPEVTYYSATGGSGDLASVMLQPGEVLAEPAEGLPITAAGYADGLFHIQLCRGDASRTDNHAFLWMEDADGREFHCTGISYFTGETAGGRTDYMDFLFAVPPEELAGCTLHGNFYTAATLTEGLWQVTFPLENTD